MPRFAIFAKFTPEALAGVRQDGYASRSAVAAGVWQQLGGELHDYYWLPSAEWDFVQIGTAPSSDAAFAILSFGAASGSFVRGDAVELRTGEEADAAAAPLRTVEYRQPGR